MFIIYTCDVFNRLNAIPLTHPCHSPHALKGQKLLAQGIALGIHVPTPGALKGQKLYMAQGEDAYGLRYRRFLYLYRRFSELSPVFCIFIAVFGVIAGKVCNFFFIFVF